MRINNSSFFFISVTLCLFFINYSYCSHLLFPAALQITEVSRAAFGTLMLFFLQLHAKLIGNIGLPAHDFCFCVLGSFIWKFTSALLSCTNPSPTIPASWPSWLRHPVLGAVREACLYRFSCLPPLHEVRTLWHHWDRSTQPPRKLEFPLVCL